MSNVIFLAEAEARRIEQLLAPLPHAVREQVYELQSFFEKRFTDLLRLECLQQHLAARAAASPENEEWQSLHEEATKQLTAAQAQTRGWYASADRLVEDLLAEFTPSTIH